MIVLLMTYLYKFHLKPYLNKIGSTIELPYLSLILQPALKFKIRN